MAGKLPVIVALLKAVSDLFTKSTTLKTSFTILSKLISNSLYITMRNKNQASQNVGEEKET